MKNPKIAALALGISFSLFTLTYAAPPGSPGPRNNSGSSENHPDQANRPPRPPVEKIAADLGLSVDVVEAAFKKMPRPTPGERPTPAQHEANLKMLAQELGVSADKLESVMDKYRPAGAPPRPPFDKIAADLGVSTDKVRAAFAKLTHPTPGQPPSETVREANRKILSQELGVSPEKIDQVMDKYRPAGGPGGSGGPPRQLMENIAKGLGVSVDKVEAAFKKVPRPATPGAPTEAERDTCQQMLARELGVSVDKIREVMAKNRPPVPPTQPNNNP